MESPTSESVPSPIGPGPLRCPQPDCGRRARRVSRKGRSIPYKNIDALALPDDLQLPTCPRCHQEFLDEEARAELLRLLPDLYAAELRHRVRIAIGKLQAYASQRQIEQLLNLSQGYLSRLRAGSGTPSAELVSHLALLALDPPARLKELRTFWRTQDTAVGSLLDPVTP